MKYVFIDSNQYRHLFSKNEGFSDEIKKLLDNLIARDHVTLLLPQQVKDEVERNRSENWFVSDMKDIDKKIAKIEAAKKVYAETLKEHPSELRKIDVKLTKEKNNLLKEKTQLGSKYRSARSKANQKLKQLFEKSTTIGESKEIVELARLRFEKKNPPSDNKLGDALIWESLLSHLKDAPAHSSLIFVARDNAAWGEHGFNPWLQKEMKDKTGVVISFTESLAEINELTQEEQDSIRKIELEELKANAISNFVNSSSFHNAGTTARALLQYKNILSEEDFHQIIAAAINNYEIYHSFFTSDPLNELCLGEGGYVRALLERIPADIWHRFASMNSIRSRRQCDINSMSTQNS